jgi:hypothetical protein
MGIAHSVLELPVAAMFVNESKRNEQSVSGQFVQCQIYPNQYVPCFSQFVPLLDNLNLLL